MWKMIHRSCRLLARQSYAASGSAEYLLNVITKMSASVLAARWHVKSQEPFPGEAEIDFPSTRRNRSARKALKKLRRQQICGHETLPRTIRPFVIPIRSLGELMPERCKIWNFSVTTWGSRCSVRLSCRDEDRQKGLRNISVLSAWKWQRPDPGCLSRFHILRLEIRLINKSMELSSTAERTDEGDISEARN